LKVGNSSLIKSFIILVRKKYFHIAAERLLPILLRDTMELFFAMGKLEQEKLLR